MREGGKRASTKANATAAMESCKIQQKKMPMSNTMAIKRSYYGVFMVFGLVTVTLYMAFAFPYSLFHLKQTETTEIKSVIIVARNGERSPSPDSYFIGEEQPADLVNFGYEQLTNTGKERMYLLGKYLKLRYYQLLLNGDPRKIYVRSADSDRCLESAQALLAGLNPPKDKWIWSSRGELNHNWQPKAVHSAVASEDDLLSAESECLKLEDKEAWKNSSRYQQLLSEFRHDLQTLRANTGLEFEDDLEMLSNVEDALRTRKAFDASVGVPSWYTSTLANRLAHISDVTAESRFSSPSVQRLYVGRLLYEIARNVNSKIRLLSLTANTGGSGSSSSSSSSTSNSNNGGGQTDNNNRMREDSDNELQLQSSANDEDPPLNVYQMQQRNKLRANPLTGPNMFIYLTSKNRLTALLNSLQVYSSQLHFGSLLLIELHHDPINQVHFLRLFTVSSQNPSTFPEPLRVNPKACLDSAECYPQQFEQNIRHLMLDKNAWQESCSLLQEPPSGFDPHTFKPQPLWPTAIDEPRPPQPLDSTLPPPPTSTPLSPSSTVDGSGSAAADEDRGTTESSGSKELEDTLIVGPLSDKKDNPSSSSSSSIDVNPQQQRPVLTNQTQDSTLPSSGESPDSTTTAATRTDPTANSSQPARGETEETPSNHRRHAQHHHHTDSIETVNNQGERMRTD